ncbi:MAG: SCO family protein [Vicinamibacteria bacterium]
MKTWLALGTALLLVLPAACKKVEKPGEIHRPSFALTDQNGKTVSVEDFRGKVVVMNFIYTRCPDPNMCVMITRKTRGLHESLTPEENAKTEFLSITLEPEYDHPEVLLEYAKHHGVDFPSHHLLTGEPEKVHELLVKEFRVAYTKSAEGLIPHEMKTTILDLSGAIDEEYIGNLWTFGEVRGKIDALLAGAGGKRGG